MAHNSDTQKILKKTEITIKRKKLPEKRHLKVDLVLYGKSRGTLI